MRDLSIKASVKINTLISKLAEEGRIDWDVANEIHSTVQESMYELYTSSKKEMIDVYNSHLSRFYGDNSIFKLKE